MQTIEGPPPWHFAQMTADIARNALREGKNVRISRPEGRGLQITVAPPHLDPAAAVIPDWESDPVVWNRDLRREWNMDLRR